MFEESDLLPLSGLQHLAFCERQWGLIHLEQAWIENILTAEGRVLHEKADEGGVEHRGDLRIVRSLRIKSLRLGLAGIADVVEFHRVVDTAKGITLAGSAGKWSIMPVEYKRGRPKISNCDRVQLCAQALCLEEMMGCAISEGALYYGEPRRRTSVVFDAELRYETEALSQRMHAFFSKGVTPTGRYSKKCKSCSLFALCRPDKIRDYDSASRFLENQLASLDGEKQ